MGVGIVPMLLSFIFPACRQAGAAGVMPPGPLDVARLQLPHSPNKSLAAPAGFRPKPEFVTPLYGMPPKALYAIVVSLARLEPRTCPLDSFPDRYQAAGVARTPVANFPDVVEAAVSPDPVGGSDLILYSHSIYGYSDFGTNAARVKRWLGAIAAKAAEGRS